MTATRWYAEISALAAVAAGIVMVVWALTLVQVVNSPWTTGLIATPITCWIALYAWHESKSRNFDSEKWISGIISTPLLGAICFAIDVFVGSGNGHYDNFLQAGFHAGGPFGILITVLVCPVGTLVCIGGWIRCSILKRLNPDTTVGT